MRENVREMRELHKRGQKNVGEMRVNWKKV